MSTTSKSRTTTDNGSRSIERATPAAWAVHPGEVLKEEFLRPLSLSSYALAKALKLPAPRIHDIVLQRRAITPDTAIRLARYFGTSAELWMNFQTAFDLSRARKAAQREILKITPLRDATAKVYGRTLK